MKTILIIIPVMALLAVGCNNSGDDSPTAPPQPEETTTEETTTEATTESTQPETTFVEKTTVEETPNGGVKELPATGGAPVPESSSPPISQQEFVPPPQPNNCHTIGSGCEDVEANAEAAWAARQNASESRIANNGQGEGSPPPPPKKPSPWVQGQLDWAAERGLL